MHMDKNTHLLRIIAISLIAIAMTTHSYALDMEDGVYCNVYAEDFCFGIDRDEILTMQIPIDFVLYDIKFKDGGSVLIYYGTSPENISDQDTLLTSSKHQPSKFQYSMYRTTNGQYRLLCEISIHRKTEYYETDTSEFVDIHLYGVTKDNVSKFNEFLTGFRRCSGSDTGVTCTKEQLFEDNLLSVDRWSSESN